MSEHITTVAEDRDAWVCLCGNTPAADGFYPCDSEGRQVEPTPGDWTTNCYVCRRCGRMIDQRTLEVVGHAQPSARQQEPAS